LQSFSASNSDINVIKHSTVKKSPKGRWNHDVLALAVAHSEHEGFGNVRE
jgi:hypothetical protein